MVRKPRGLTAPWSDEELRHSIEVYLLLLRMQIQGSDARAEPAVQLVVGPLLPSRNEAAIRYRMRNISFVVARLGLPTLRNFSPADGVGNGVAARIEKLLKEHPYFLSISPKVTASIGDARADASQALGRLRAQVEDMIAEIERRGHNGPPSLLDEGLDRSQLLSALDDIDTVNRELERPVPDMDRAKNGRDKLRLLLATLGRWMAERATKFVDAALVAAGPLVIAKVTGLLPALVDAIEATSKWIGH